MLVMVEILMLGLENREYGRMDLSRWPRGTLYPQKLALTSPTSNRRSVGIVRSRTQAMEFSFSFLAILMKRPMTPEELLKKSFNASFCKLMFVKKFMHYHSQQQLNNFHFLFTQMFLYCIMWTLTL
jgi:hypothetical protein